MSEVMKQAQAQLEAAQRRVAALSVIPEQDDFPVGTIIRWCRADQSRRYVAVKHSATSWHISGLDCGTFRSWEYLARAYFGEPLAYFEVAPDDWTDARRKPPFGEEDPPITLRGAYRLTDELTGISWNRVGDEWVRA